MRASGRSRVDVVDVNGVVATVKQASTLPAEHPVRPLTRHFLTWLASAPRTHAEVMAAWQTSCPRLSIWEDALDEGLVRVERGETAATSQVFVTLTALGRAVLERRS